MEKIYAGFTEEEKKLLRRKHKDIAAAAGGRSAKYVSFIINGNRPINSKLSREIYRVCRELLILLNPREKKR